MVLARRQAQTLINQVNNININRTVQITSPVVKYFLSPFEGNINTADPHGIEIYLKATKEIDNKSEKLDISVSNVRSSCELCFYPIRRKT